MIKITVMNLKGFLETVNRCRGRVMMLSPDGRKTDITRQYEVQHALTQQYQKNRKLLPLSLTFDEPKDFMDVVAYYAGDC